MKKNGFLTFLFACIPGAGQMYYGYMQRGLSLLALFCLGFGLSAIIGPLVLICPIVWMYSFFDTYDLIRRMTQGTPREDSLLLLDGLESLRGMLPTGRRLLGWALIALGVWALYSSLVEPVIIYVLGWYAADIVPTLVVAGLLIAAGCWLLFGRHGGSGSDRIPPFTGGSPDFQPGQDDAAGSPDFQPGQDDAAGSAAPQWPRVGVRRPAANEGDPRSDAESSASDSPLTDDTDAGNFAG